MACSSACPTQDHETYGSCLRAKGIQIDRFSLTQAGKEPDKRKDHTLERFRQCVKAGVIPQSPLKTAVEKAERQLDSA